MQLNILVYLVETNLFEVHRFENECILQAKFCVYTYNYLSLSTSLTFRNLYVCIWSLSNALYILTFYAINLYCVEAFLCNFKITNIFENCKLQFINSLRCIVFFLIVLFIRIYFVFVCTFDNSRQHKQHFEWHLHKQIDKVTIHSRNASLLLFSVQTAIDYCESVVFILNTQLMLF